MTMALLVGVLAVLIAAPALRRLQPPPRRLWPQTRAARPTRRPAPDYASQLDAIAREVRSGSSLTSAVLNGIDRSCPLGEVANRLGNGGSLADSLTAISPGDADLALTVQALSATAHLGGPVAATLDEAAAVLRERAAARAERRAHAAQARLSGRVLTVVPLAFAAWNVVASSRTRDAYTSTVAGGLCALCGLALNLVGWRWMKRIIGPA